jgi:DNA-binding response OmpR family regulator
MNGHMALGRIVQEQHDLIILDLMLPGLDGMEICQRVREVSNVPIIMLTAKDTIEDKVQGLDMGADDYLTKPFAIRELLARIRAISRKQTFNAEPFTKTELQVRNLTIFTNSFEVAVNGENIQLTKREYELLEYMVFNKNIVLKREQILQEVWGYCYLGDTKVVDVYIRHLRSKLDERFGEQYIRTVRGVGYVVKD